MLGIGLPIINVANTRDKRGVGKLLHKFVVSFDKTLNKPQGPIVMPKRPEITAMGNPNLSNWTASLNLLPKIKKKTIIKNPNKLIIREFEKKF